MKIIDITNRESFSGLYLLNKAEVKTTRNGSPYIAMTFQDDTGRVMGNFWDASGEDINDFKTGVIVDMDGIGDEYNGTPQVKIMSIGVYKGEYDMADFTESYEIEDDYMDNFIESALNTIKNQTINKIVSKIIYDNLDKYKTYPAASFNHHAKGRGLIYHTIGMVRMALSFSRIHDEMNLNESLLVGGILLHDLGKIVELSGPVSTEYTLEGNMIGHISVISEMVSQAAIELGIDPKLEDVLLLKHVLLSHHGKQEWGSPVTPKIIEAEVVHLIDALDAKTNSIFEALECTETGANSQKVFSADNRKFYKHNID